MIGLVFIFLLVAFFKVFYRFLELLIKILLWAILVGLILSYLFLISWGSASFALWAINRELNGKSSHWQGIIAAVLMPVSLYLLTTPGMKEFPWFFNMTAQGTASAVILLIVYLGVLLFNLSRKRVIHFLPAVVGFIICSGLLLMGIRSYDQNWHISKMALADEHEFASVYQELKREKYRADYEIFYKTHPHIQAKHFRAFSKLNRYKTNFNSLDYRSDELILEQLGCMVGIIYYTTENGFNNLAYGQFINGMDGRFSNGTFIFDNPEHDPAISNNTRYSYAVEQGLKVYREESLEANLVPANLDDYIEYRENISYDDQVLGASLYISTAYLHMFNLPMNPPTIDESGKQIDRERMMKTFGKKY